MVNFIYYVVKSLLILLYFSLRLPLRNHFKSIDPQTSEKKLLTEQETIFLIDSLTGVKAKKICNKLRKTEPKPENYEYKVQTNRYRNIFLCFLRECWQSLHHSMKIQPFYYFTTDKQYDDIVEIVASYVLKFLYFGQKQVVLSTITDEGPKDIIYEFYTQSGNIFWLL